MLTQICMPQLHLHVHVCCIQIFTCTSRIEIETTFSLCLALNPTGITQVSCLWTGHLSGTNSIIVPPVPPYFIRLLWICDVLLYLYMYVFLNLNFHVVCTCTFQRRYQATCLYAGTLLYLRYRNTCTTHILYSAPSHWQMAISDKMAIGDKMAQVQPHKTHLYNTRTCTCT